MRTPGHRPSGTALKQAVFLTGLILLVEVVAGVLSHSLALLSDAGHILTDVAALGLAWFAVEQAKRPADARRTYGYHRVGILTAMANGATLILIVAAIGYEAVRRILHPEPVQGGLVVVVALVAIGANTYIALRLRGSRDNLNVRAAMLHVLGDLAASVGVVISGVIIVLTGWLYADPLISLGIGALIAWGGIKIVIDTVDILLEATPREVDLEQVRELIATTKGVTSVHDLHVWSLAPGHLALSCHVVVGREATAVDTEHLVRALEEEVCGRFNIGHTTMQAEACHPCDPEATHGLGEHNHPHVRAHGDPPLPHRHP